METAGNSISLSKADSFRLLALFDEFVNSAKGQEKETETVAFINRMTRTIKSQVVGTSTASAFDTEKQSHEAQSKQGVKRRLPFSNAHKERLSDETLTLENCSADPIKSDPTRDALQEAALACINDSTCDWSELADSEGIEMNASFAAEKSTVGFTEEEVREAALACINDADDEWSQLNDNFENCDTDMEPPVKMQRTSSPIHEASPLECLAESPIRGITETVIEPATPSVSDDSGEKTIIFTPLEPPSSVQSLMNFVMDEVESEVLLEGLVDVSFFEHISDFESPPASEVQPQPSPLPATTTSPTPAPSPSPLPPTPSPLPAPPPSDLNDNRRRRIVVKVQQQQQQAQSGYGANDTPVLFELNKITDDVYSSDVLNRDVYTTQFSLRHNLNDIDILAAAEELDKLFGNMIRERTVKYGENDIVSVKISHGQLASEIFKYETNKKFRSEDILTSLVEVAQSNRSFLLDGTLSIEVAILKEKSGSGRTRLPQTMEEKRKRKTGLIEINNRDNSCGYMAIALAVYYYEHRNDRTRHERDAMKKNRGGRLKRLASELFSELPVDIESPMTMADIEIISNFLLQSEYMLIVVNGKTATKDFAPEIITDKRLYIEHLNDHYNVITKIASYFDKAFFCYFCWTAFNHKESHRCVLCCDRCQECEWCRGDDIHCESCNRTFKGQNCFENHKKYLCAKRKFCRFCETEYTPRAHKPHLCLQYTCKVCGDQYQHSPHYCTMKAKDLDKLKKQDAEQTQIFVAFDIESRLDKNRYSASVQKHTAILIKSFAVCKLCFDDVEYRKIVRDCELCGEGMKTFRGEDCATFFCDYLYNDLSVRAGNKGRVFVFSHNFRGYDGHFILREVFERDFACVNPIMRGNKILKLDIGNVRFMDTLCFFQTPLSSLPKMFGFENRVVKGFFPYTFNTIENEGYVGQIPSINYFSTDRMKTEELLQFRRWHESRSNADYNLQHEMERYCENDVEIVLFAMMSFKRIMTELTGLNPLTRNFTIASVVFEAQRALFLPNRTIGITPTSGYRLKRSSAVCSAWLDMYQTVHNKTIVREYRVGKYYADGCLIEDHTLFEFFGCFFHGCPTCYPENRDDRHYLGKSANELLRECEIKVNYFQKLGYTVITIFECDFNLHLSTADKEVKEYLNERIEHYKLQQRYGVCEIRNESFMGGRTNNFRFHYEASENETIRLLDIRSSYPNVMKKRKYWAGHPISINENFDYSLASYSGFVKAVVLPPKRLFVCVLPVRVNEKLQFPLCRSCVADEEQRSCDHSDEERCLVWTWTTDTLKLAVSYGYKIITIIHVLHYPEEIDDLFSGQINLFGKTKIEASGFPADVVTEEEKVQYVNNMYRNEGILLDLLSIEYNAPKRSVTKIGLNANFGKMGQNPNLPKTLVCRDYATLWNVMKNDEHEILGSHNATEDVVIISYRLKDIEKCSPGNTSVAIASKITDAGRDELYKILDFVVGNGPDRLLYCDTDSVMYVERPGDRKLKTGAYFGDLTDEIRDNYGPNAKITRMVACGPKNYAYEIDVNGERKAVVKIKGIQQDASTISTVNIEKMLEMVKQYLDGEDPTVPVKQFRIRADGMTHEVNSFNFQKLYRCLSEKRRICSDRNGTVPYGWVGECPY